MKFAKKLLLGSAYVCGLSVAASGHALIISSPASDAVVVDGNAGTPAVSTIKINPIDLGGKADKIVDISVAVDFMKCAGAAADLTPLPASCPAGFAFANEIQFLLTGPDGTTTVGLVFFDTYDAGQDPGSRIVVTFRNDAVSPPVNFPDVGGSDFSTGTFNPAAGFMSPFEGKGAVGDWTLSIEDQSEPDPLAFVSYTLNITLAEPQAQVPVPATALLLGLGIAGLAAARRRRR